MFTHQDHRKLGLCGIVIRQLLKAFDDMGGKVLSLGTDTPHAASTYAKVGF